MDRARGIAGILAGIGMLATSAAHGADAPPAFRISGIIGLSGPLAIIGVDMRRGVEIALDDRDNKLGGVPIQITWDDSEGKPQVTVQKAAQRIAQGTDMIFGEIASPPTIALSALTEQRQTPLLVTFAADNSLTAPGKLHWTFRTGKNVDSTVGSTFELAVHAHYKRMFGILPDYAASRVPLALASRQYVIENGQIIWSGTTGELQGERGEIERMIGL